MEVKNMQDVVGEGGGGQKTRFIESMYIIS